MGLAITNFSAWRFGLLYVLFAVLFIVLGSKGGGNLTVKGGEVGLHFFFEYFFVVLEKLFKDIVDEIPDAAGRPVSGA